MKTRAVWLLILLCFLAGCGKQTQNEATPTPGAPSVPQLPEKLSLDDDGVPLLSVYVTADKQVSQMDIETYLHGVLAGEMKNDWPLEALKAQAILARTFVLKFCTEKESRYQGADISTDIEEAQAYDASGVNERVKQAVRETRGQVLSVNGELPYAWFHAHAGGMTAKAKEGLAYKDDEPTYTQVVKGNESDKAPQSAQTWQATFTDAQILSAAKEAGAGGLGATLDSMSVDERGDSGRAVSFLINGARVSAPNLRIALGSSVMRSTLLTSVAKTDGGVSMAGKGYGHGVGMPQWGAYGMAEQGKTAEDIVLYYFKDAQVASVW